MDVTIEKKGSNTRLLKVQLPSARMQGAFDNFYKEIGPKAKVAGFRPGKVPRQVLEKRFRDEAQQEVMRVTVPDTCRQIMSDKKLQPVMAPMLIKADWQGDGALYFEAQIDLMPDVKLPRYKGVKVEVTARGLKDEDVETTLTHLRERHAQLAPLAGRGLQGGDQVIVDQKIAVGETVLENNTDLTYDLDETKLNKDIYRGLLGEKPGNTVAVGMKVPEGYPKKEWVGKDATVTVTLKEAKEKKLPELNDEFAKENGQCENLAQLRERIRESMQQYEDGAKKMQIENKVHEALVAGVKVEIPERLVAQQARHLHEQAVERKQAPENPDEAYTKQLLARALDQLKLHFIYEKIAKDEKIEVGEAEIDQRIEEIAKGVGQEAFKVKEYYKKDDRLDELKSRIKQDKVTEFLVSNAKVTLK